MCNAQSAICTIILTQRYDFFLVQESFVFINTIYVMVTLVRIKGRANMLHTLQILLIKRLQFNCAYILQHSGYSTACWFAGAEET